MLLIKLIDEALSQEKLNTQMSNHALLQETIVVTVTQEASS